MIEQGIVKLVQGTASVIALTPQGGGFLGTLPEDVSQTNPSWTYIIVSHDPQTALNSIRGLAFLRLQIDCYAPTGDKVIKLARQIDLVLHGYRGTLTDTDSTYVDSCFQSDMQDFPLDPQSRTFRRMLEYEIKYRN